MITNPDLLLAHVRDYRREMIADAERDRLLRAALRSRKERKAARRRAAAAAADPAAVSAAEGTLNPCGERAPAPAQ